MMGLFPIDPNERYAAPVLLRELGVFRTLRVAAALKRAAARGEPFQDLPPPADERERLSRAQIGPALVLYRLLLPSEGRERALQVTHDVVVAAGAHFLRQSLGTLSRDELSRLDDAGREAFAKSRSEAFFNADMTFDEISGQRVRFTVSHCHFPVLCAAVGLPEVAPIFCAVDSHYFENVERGVVLERPETIASGGQRCRFSLAFAEPNP